VFLNGDIAWLSLFRDNEGVFCMCDDMQLGRVVVRIPQPQASSTTTTTALPPSPSDISYLKGCWTSGKFTVTYRDNATHQHLFAGFCEPVCAVEDMLGTRIDEAFPVSIGETALLLYRSSNNMFALPISATQT
jgi:hypothetical protein